MKQIVEIPVKNGPGPVYVEVDAPEAGTLESRVDTHFEELLGNVQGVTNGFISALQDLKLRPDTVDLEFNVGFKAESSKAWAIVGKASADAGIKVSLSWKRQSAEE